MPFDLAAERMSMNRARRELMSAAIGSLSALCLMIAAVGCGDPNAKFIPTPETAEHALDQGLAAWKAGKPSGMVEGTRPQIYVTDTSRKAGQELIEYKILGETASRHGRTFMVELSFDKPQAQLKAEYIIVGIDPIWVFRREDYELLMHWDHYMPEAPKQAESPEKPNQEQQAP